MDRHNGLRPAGIPVAISAAALIVAACSGGSAAASPTQGAVDSPQPRTIEVKTLDALRFEPDRITVNAGETVRFVVSNPGAVDHEFVIGTAAEQEEHAMGMEGEGGMEMEENEVEVAPGETRELVYTFGESGELLAGCHLPGHWEGGMRATIEVRP